MHDAVIVTLIILTTALLRWSLLTNPDVSPDVWAGEEENGSTTLALVPVPVERPHSTRITKPKR